MSDFVKDEECEKRRDTIHTRINQRAPWYLLLPMLLALLGALGGAYKYTHSVELAQKDLVTKQDLKDVQDRIVTAIGALVD